MAKAKQNTAEFAAELAQPLLSQLGLLLWDVRYEKEGGGWYLRYFLDKEGGISIDDCEKFSRAIDPILDAADPIEQTYCLEVSSPGIERELTRPWHFAANLGRPVTARYIRPKNGLREVCGDLVSHTEGETVIRTADNTEVVVTKTELAYIRLQDDFDYSEGEKV